MAEAPVLVNRAVPSPIGRRWADLSDKERADRSQRIKDGQARARTQGRVGGRRKGSGATPSIKGRTAGEKEPKGRARAATAKERRQIMEASVLCIKVSDMVLASASQSWADPNMRLKDPEVLSLADALTDEALASEYVKRLMLRMVEQSIHLKLAGVMIGIAIPRLAYKGVLPQELFSYVASPGPHPGQEPGPEYEPEPEIPEGVELGGHAAPAAPLEAGGAHGDSGRHGLGQIDLGGRIVDIAEVRPDLPVESGPGELSNGSPGDESQPSDEGPPPPPD